MRIKRGGRTPEERIVDKFLVLYTIADSGQGVGDTILQKLTFLSSKEMQGQGYKGFNYAFIKLHYGPFSSELQNDVSELENAHMISPLAHNATPFGLKVLDAFSHIFDQNSIITDKIKRTNRKYAHIPRDELVDLVHRMKNPVYPRVTIHNTDPKRYVLRRPTIWDPDREFKISEEDLASLEIYLNPKALSSLVKSVHSAKSKPSIKLSDVLENV
ncbi:MAG: hypothetical protein NWE89_05280 [Candidatus Bathyarchaeota archaeon]|nr:hypothetical protein [Candidatus Bathyarchaeota archaeon]